MTDYYNTHGSGGGYMQASQGSPSGSPGGGTRHQSPSLRPVVVKQVLDATSATDEKDVIIDGVETSQMTFVAQVLTHSAQATNLIIQVDDGTARVEIRKWIEVGPGQDIEAEKTRMGCREHSWIRVLGNIKPYSNKRLFVAQLIRPVTDLDEVHFALLEALSVHLYYTKGPPSGALPVGQGNVPSAYAPGASSGATQDPWAHLPVMQRKIVHYIVNSAPSEEGIHIGTLTKGLGKVDAADVSEALERLTEDGHIYNTKDEFHYNVSM